MNTPNDMEPCRHVRKYVEAQAVGKPRRWYNLFGWLHVKHCPQCQESLRRLAAYFNTINEGDSESPNTQQSDLMDTLRARMLEE